MALFGLGSKEPLPDHVFKRIGGVVGLLFGGLFGTSVLFLLLDNARSGSKPAGERLDAVLLALLVGGLVVVGSIGAGAVVGQRMGARYDRSYPPDDRSPEAVLRRRLAMVVQAGSLALIVLVLVIRLLMP